MSSQRVLVDDVRAPNAPMVKHARFVARMVGRGNRPGRRETQVCQDPFPVVRFTTRCVCRSLVSDTSGDSCYQRDTNILIVMLVGVGITS